MTASAAMSAEEKSSPKANRKKKRGLNRESLDRDHPSPGGPSRENRAAGLPSGLPRASKEAARTGTGKNSKKQSSLPSQKKKEKRRPPPPSSRQDLIPRKEKRGPAGADADPENNQNWKDSSSGVRRLPLMSPVTSSALRRISKSTWTASGTRNSIYKLRQRVPGL